MTRKRTLISDGAWVAGMQSLAALGHLAGIRLLTEILPPSVFGKFGLWLGVVTLVAAGMANPTMQALLRFYPEYAQRGEGGLVRTAACWQLAKLALWTLPLFAGGIISVITYGWANQLTVVLLIALIAVEMLRMQGTALLNAVRAHRAYGLWAVAESWGRPLFAWALVSVAGISTTLVLAGYFMASLCSWIVMRQFLPRESVFHENTKAKTQLEKRFWKYVLPLLPLGVLGWITGMADRYMIGALLSPAEVGLYVAIYGLASRPMLMFGGIIETTLRPVYQSALVEGNSARARVYLKRWALIIFLGSVMTIVLTWLGHEWLAWLLLGDQYRAVSYLMPWIVGGYALCLQYYVLSRVCYAHGATQSILFMEALGALLAITVGYICIKQAGLYGAAIAVPLYFGAQFVAGLVLSRKWLLSGGIKLSKGPVR